MSEKKGWDSASEAYVPFEAFTGQFSAAAADALCDVLRASASGGAASRPLRVMDVAAGTGASTFAVCKTLAELCRELGATAEVVATDFSESMLKIFTDKLGSTSSSDSNLLATQAAVKEGLLQVSSQVADAQDLSAYGDGSFDVIVCTFGIMFPPSPEKVVREFWRLLKPGGVAVTTTWHYNNAVSDMLTDLAHALKGRGRFEEMPLSAATMKFGSEAFMRRLFRGDLDEGPTVWKDPDLEARFVPGSQPCLPRHMSASLNKNPVASELAPWDEGEAEAHLLEKFAGEDGHILLRGTALLLIARKPS